MASKEAPSPWPLESSIAELGQLVTTAGAQVITTVTQSLDQPTPTSYVGKGKLAELVQTVQRIQCDLVVFDDELSPGQQRNLENALKVKVIDRTALILDIFARHARTREGRLQVELAQHEYLLPRLTGQWSHLERLGGGIGTRGPGESQLETDRRLIRRRIQRLKADLEEVRRHRDLYRRRRAAEGLPQVSLVGYTNAGKSTLFNVLSAGGVLVEDKLFATLDPTTRRITLPSGQEVLLSDTVGFIQKLPPSIVAAFRATLEELENASLLLHVLDFTHPNAAEQSQTVEETLRTLKLQDKPQILVFNKVDRLVDDGDAASRGQDPSEEMNQVAGQAGDEISPKVFVSAQRGWGLQRLMETMGEELSEEMMPITVAIPYPKSGLVNIFRRFGQVNRQDHQAGATVLEGRIPRRLQRIFGTFRVKVPRR